MWLWRSEEIHWLGAECLPMSVHSLPTAQLQAIPSAGVHTSDDEAREGVTRNPPSSTIGGVEDDNGGHVRDDMKIHPDFFPKNRLDKAVVKGSKRRPGVRQTVVKGGKKLEITLVQAA